MAKATKVPSDYEVTLTLNRDEAEVLRALVGKCSGGHDTQNKHAAAIYGALGVAGVGKLELKMDGFYFR